MAITKEEVDRLYERQREVRKKEEAIRSGLLSQAKVKVEAVTNHEQWDYYLSLVQHKLEEAKTNELDWMQKCANANEERDWHIAQRTFAAWQARALALEEVITLPKTIIDAAK